MNIVYASDDSFAPIMGVSIQSLLENNKDCNKINIFILNDNITVLDKNTLKILIFL